MQSSPTYFKTKGKGYVALKYIQMKYNLISKFLVPTKMSSSTATGTLQTIRTEKLQKMQQLLLIFYIPHADSLCDI